jgi:hypothetical protein
MRKLAITLALTSMLSLVAASMAALPTRGPFAGKTSVHSINGFNDLVTFKAATNGLSLTKFTFGTLGCFGHGSFPVGTDPYGDPMYNGLVKSIPVASNGTFLTTTTPVFGGTTVVTTATIKGSFTSANAVSGTITIKQSNNGDTCGPTTMKFTAAPGTPTSLGIG